MANATGAFGLRPTRRYSGGSPTYQVERCYVGSNYATALFIGDPVLLSPTAADKDTTGKLQTINASDGLDGSIIWGVIVGFEPLQTDLTKVYNPASTERVALVCTDPDMVYEIRGDGGGTPTKNFIGANAVMIATGSGSTVTGLSGFHLDEGTATAPSADQSNPLLIIGIKDSPDNTLGDNAIYEVLLNTNRNAVGERLGVVAA